MSTCRLPQFEDIETNRICIARAHRHRKHVIEPQQPRRVRPQPNEGTEIVFRRVDRLAARQCGKDRGTAPPHALGADLDGAMIADIEDVVCIYLQRAVLGNALPVAAAGQNDAAQVALDAAANDRDESSARGYFGYHRRRADIHA